MQAPTMIARTNIQLPYLPAYLFKFDLTIHTKTAEALLFMISIIVGIHQLTSLSSIDYRKAGHTLLSTFVKL
jgi:hypothetical protein